MSKSNHHSKHTRVSKTSRRLKLKTWIGVLLVLIVAIVGLVIIRLSQAASLQTLPRSLVVSKAQSQIGATEFSWAVLLYTQNNREAWCADFVSYIYNASGKPFFWSKYPDTQGKRWRMPLVADLQSGAVFLGAWRERSSGYLPKPGDLIFFDNAAGGRFNHVGIVERIDATYVYTIEGNTGGDNPNAAPWVEAGDKVMRKSYKRTDTGIQGYGNFFND